MGAWASLPSLPGSLLNWVWCKCWSMSQGFSYNWPWCCYDTPVHPTKASLLWSIARGECSSQTCPYFSTPNIVFSLFVLDKKVLKYFKPSPSNAQPPNWVSPLHFRSSCESCCIWYPHPSHPPSTNFPISLSQAQRTGLENIKSIMGLCVFTHLRIHLASVIDQIWSAVLSTPGRHVIGVCRVAHGRRDKGQGSERSTTPTT